MLRQTATVESIERQDAHMQVLVLSGRQARAICYVDITGACAAGDEVLVNATATALGLGTGGYDFVMANLTRPASPDDVPAADTGARGIAPGWTGRMMKLRYSPVQVDVASIEEEGSPHHDAMAQATTLEGMPVVCCELLSQLPLVAAGIRSRLPEARIVFCMTDEAALPFQFSNVARQCIDTGLVNLAITCGQATGGNAEAITLHSGLLAARQVFGADAAIVSMGPGIAGTATPFGHGGVAQAESINAAAALGGLPVAPLRLSFSDDRPRHRGLSHHTAAALGTLALARAWVPMPDCLDHGQRATVLAQLDEAGIRARHEVLDVEVGRQPIDTRGIEVTTMGRGFGDDPAFFWAAFAAGICAGDAAGRLDASRGGA